MAQAIDAPATVDRVVLEGVVVLQIINHCHASLPQMVTGQLLGLDRKEELQVTSSFPSLYRTADQTGWQSVTQREAREEEIETEARQYQYEMLHQLREVNIDSNMVGWYISSWLESSITTSVIETQFSYQQDLGSACVCIAYDPLKTTQGRLHLTALRLKPSFMRQYKNGDFTQEMITSQHFNVDSVFDELPIVIHNNVLIDKFIGELGCNKDFADQTAVSSTFELDGTGYLTKGLESLVEANEELWQAWQKYAYEQKRAKNAEMYGKDDHSKPPRPSRLDSLMILKQLANHCDFLEEGAVPLFEKLYFREALHNVTTTTEDAP